MHNAVKTIIRTGPTRGYDRGPEALRGGGGDGGELGLKNGTAQRVLAGETSIGLELLAVLAEKLRVEPWQLLVPGLDPRALPSLGKNPNLKPGAAHVVACMDQMDDSGVDVMVKMADALIRPPASSLAMPTTPQPQTQ